MEERHGLGLVTDLYELTMAASYHARGMNDTATFDLFVRSLPKQRNFLVASGIAEALEGLESYSFTEADREYLASTGRFGTGFLEELGRFRFSGEVWAVEEGEIVFGSEPIMSVTAPLIEAQVVETYLINLVAASTMLASKAARVQIACGGIPFVDFSLRRDHGRHAGMLAARASYLCGAVGTSNVLAAATYGIAPSGTMAHSYIMAFGDETEAFRAYGEDMPSDPVFLIDTYDTIEGARRAAAVARELMERDIYVRAVRLDSGDPATLAPKVRRILDEAGCPDVQIFVSGDLDEHRVQDLVRLGVPVDAFGVGTQLGTSADAPNLGAVYKLACFGPQGRMKLSDEKATYPGRKQVFRVERDGVMDHDVLALLDEEVEGRPLMRTFMRDGKIVGRGSLDDGRRRAMANLDALPEHLRSLVPVRDPYRVELSPGLKMATDALRGRLRG
jgi:nicotinate phosphoribosyltransferase